MCVCVAEYASDTLDVRSFTAPFWAGLLTGPSSGHRPRPATGSSSQQAATNLREVSLGPCLQLANGVAKPPCRQIEPPSDVVLHGRRPSALAIDDAEGVHLDECPDLLIGDFAREREPKLTAAVDADPRLRVRRG